MVGPEVGFLDFVGVNVGMAEFDGDVEGEEEGAMPHSAESMHGIQTSVFRKRILKFSGFDDLNPPIH